MHIAGTQDLNIDDIVRDAKRRDAEIRAEQGVPVRPHPSTVREPVGPIAIGEPVQPVPIGVSDVQLEPKSDDDKDSEDDKDDPGKLAKICGFIRMFMTSVLNSLTFAFNRWSRDYRYVAFILKGEKQRLKERLHNELENEDDYRRVRETIFNNEIARDVQQVQTQADVEA